MSELVNDLVSAANFKKYSLRFTNESSTIYISYYRDLYFKFLIDLLLRLEPTFELAKANFIAKCKNYYRSEPQTIEFLEDIDSFYDQECVVYLYTKNSFLYRFLNEALRSENLSAILLSHFIIIDLFKALEKGYAQLQNVNDNTQSRQYYRGQRMSTDELEEMQLTIGEFTIVKSFFSATLDLKTALAFSGSHGSQPKDEKLHVLLKIMVDLSVKHLPFAELTEQSEFKVEREVLFTPGSIFRIEDVIYDTNINVWVIHVSLVGENDQRLLEKFDYENLTTSSLASQISKVGHLIGLRCSSKIRNNSFYYDYLLNKLSLDNLCRSTCYSDLGWYAYYENDYPMALSCQQKALEICDTLEDSDEKNKLRSIIFNSLGVIHHCTDNDKLALEYYTRAFDITDSCPPVDQYSLFRKFLNNSTFNMARWHKMSNNFKLALIHYGGLVKTTTLRREVQSFMYSELSESYATNSSVGDAQESHQISFIDFSAKYFPQFHLEIATTYLSVGKNEEAMKLFLMYAPGDKESIIDCYSELARSSHTLGNFSHEIACYEKVIEFLLENSAQLHYMRRLSYTYKRIADAYFSSGQINPAADWFKKAIECFKRVFLLETSSDKPYRTTIQASYNGYIEECYDRLADIYQEIGDAEAADDARRKASTDLITIDPKLEHDNKIMDLTVPHIWPGCPKEFNQKLIDKLVIAQAQVKQTDIYKCSKGDELQGIVCNWNWSCSVCERWHESNVPTWKCSCVPYCYHKCDRCIVKELLRFDYKRFHSILQNAPAL